MTSRRLYNLIHSKMGPGFELGEVERRYGRVSWIERLDAEAPRGRWACFLLAKR